MAPIDPLEIHCDILFNLSPSTILWNDSHSLSSLALSTKLIISQLLWFTSIGTYLNLFRIQGKYKVLLWCHILLIHDRYHILKDNDSKCSSHHNEVFFLLEYSISGIVCYSILFSNYFDLCLILSKKYNNVIHTSD